MCKNKLIIAAAGSGKTTEIVKRAREITDQNVLITTYTEANEKEIRKKFKGSVPKNITIKTWFSFLLQHGVRPYQSVLNDELHNKKIGFLLTEEKSGKKYNPSGEVIIGSDHKTGKTFPLFWGEKDFKQYYFSKELKIYSDKIAKFIFECNKSTKEEVIKRIARIYPNIFIDEVQDLAGWELEIIKLLFESSSKILLVGDPRQVTYLTHHPTKYKKYKDGNIKEFIKKECKKDICEIDLETLKNTHRNNQVICDFSSKLFPDFDKSEPCKCVKCRQKVDHEGVFLIQEKDIEEYIKQYPKITILKEKEAVFPDWNFGKSKGLTFERVIIYPTKNIKKWIKNNTQQLAQSTRSKFYVAVTRARYSVAIVYNYKDDEEFQGVKKWKVGE